MGGQRRRSLRAVAGSLGVAPWLRSDQRTSRRAWSSRKVPEVADEGRGWGRAGGVHPPTLGGLGAPGFLGREVTVKVPGHSHRAGRTGRRAGARATSASGPPVLLAPFALSQASSMLGPDLPPMDIRVRRGNVPVTPTRVRAPRQAAFLAERWRLGTWARQIPRRPSTRRAPRGPNAPLPPLAPPRPSRCLLAPLPSCSHLCHEPGPFRPPPWRWHSAQGVAGVSGHPASTTRAAGWSLRAVTLLGAGVGTLT